MKEAPSKESIESSFTIPKDSKVILSGKKESGKILENIIKEFKVFK